MHHPTEAHRKGSGARKAHAKTVPQAKPRLKSVNAPKLNPAAGVHLAHHHAMAQHAAKLAKMQTDDDEGEA